MNNKTTQLNITHINIEDLFGIYTYSIPMDSTDISKLLILYGNNGAGKTTLLQIIFNLLSSENKKGHKTELANTKFKTISITLSNGYIIKAYRENFIGNYKLHISKNSEELIDIVCHTITENEKYIVRDGNKGSAEVQDFLNILKELNLSIHYLSDDRKIKTNLTMLLDETKDSIEISNIPLEMLKNTKSFSINDAFLLMAIGKVENWFKTEVNIGNSIGQNDIQEIYFNIIENLLDDSKKEEQSSNITINKKDFLEKLKKLNSRNQEFMKYELILDYKLEKYIDLINKISKDKLEAISTTLNPYIDGIEKRLNAIESTKNIINTFITILNEFYLGKELSFSITTGLTINSTYGEKEILKPTMLSSGEKQLLLLFCNTISAREEASIFIIDEPELSLNVVWQRKLIDALLSFSEDSSIQFILASHSIELLTQYQENVCVLENIKEF